MSSRENMPPDEVLFVDDEENVLNAVERLFKFSRYRTVRAHNANEALDILSAGNIAVVVSDNQMPGMKGVELLGRTKLVAPDTVRILMTAYADLPTALDAINMGEVYKFVVKPWDNDDLVRTVDAAVERFGTIRSLRNADENTMRSIAQTIELKDHHTRGHCDRVAEYSLLMADTLGLPIETKREIKYGSWLHDCGKIGVPEAILNADRRLYEDEFNVIKNHPAWGAEVARLARLPEIIVNIILCHHEHYDGMGYPAGLTAEKIPVEARIVAVADVYDAITSHRPYSRALDVDHAIFRMMEMRGRKLDPGLLDMFIDCIRGNGTKP